MIYGQIKGAEMGRGREEESRRKNIRKEQESGERRWRCEKRQESHETLCFSNVLWLAKATGAGPSFVDKITRARLADNATAACNKAICYINSLFCSYPMRTDSLSHSD